MRRLAIVSIVLVCAVLLGVLALAANDPGHDTLYIEEQGNSTLTGNLNISQQLRVANLIYSSYLDILGNGTKPPGSYAQIYALSSGNDIAINAPTNIWLAYDAGSQVHVGQSNVDLNVSRTIYVGSDINATGNIYTGNVIVQKRVSGTCAAGLAIATINSDGSVVCQATTGGNSGGGWSNTTTTTSTSLDVNVDAGTFYVNSTSNQIGIGTLTPSKKLEVSNGSQSLTIDPTLATSILVNTSGTTNLTITSANGSVIIRLGP